jgi:hypothetical protein
VENPSNGLPLQLNGLQAFLGNWETGKRAKIADYTPDDLNILLAFVLNFLDRGAESIYYLLASEGITSYSVDDIQILINQVALYINRYWYNDGIDNDGNGGADEEIIDGLDNDGDGLIDEDSRDGSPPYAPKTTIYHNIFNAWRTRLSGI